MLLLYNTLSLRRIQSPSYTFYSLFILVINKQESLSNRWGFLFKIIARVISHKIE